MIRVLTMAPNVYDGTSFYRLGGVMPYLEREYSDIHIKDLSHKSEVDWADYCSYDVAVVQRPFIKQHYNTVCALKNMGIKVIVDWDDDIVNLPQHNPYFQTYNENRENIMLIASVADHIWVSTDGLKREFSKYNASIEVIPNAHNDYMFPVKDKKPFDSSTRKVAYRGGTTHEVDVYKHLEDWKHIINNNKDYEFFFFGARFAYLEEQCGDNYIIVPGAHLIDYFKHYQMVNPNIFIYPLDNNLFNNSKSNISWIEATYAGAAVMAPVFHKDFHKPGVALFGDSFVEKFDEIKNSPGILSEMNVMSWEYIKENLLLSHINSKRYNSICDVKNRK